jgi:hypothetical protein
MLTIIAALLIVAGVALYVALPLSGGLIRARRAPRAGAERERLEHERALAVQALREFDRETGKLSAADYDVLRAGLEERALAAMSALERLDARRREPARVTSLPERLHRKSDPSGAAGAGRVAFCPQCGQRVASGANFCAECGMGLRPLGRATGWTD